MSPRPEVLRRINDYSVVIAAGTDDVAVGDEIRVTVDAEEVPATVVDVGDEKAVAEITKADLRTYS